MNKWMYKLSRYSKKNTTISHLVNFIYSIFSNTIFTSISIILITAIWIPIIIMNIDKIKISLIYIELWKPILMLLLIQILSSIATFYKTRYLINYKAAQNSLKMVSGLNNTWADRVQTLIEDIADNPGIHKFNDFYKKHSDYRKRASFLCDMLYRIIQETFHTDDHQISIMHKAEDETGEYIKMIAYKNKRHEAPSDFRTKFYFKDSIYKNYYHVQQFTNGKRGVKAIINKKELKKKLTFNPDDIERENSIKQFIAIPIIDNERDIVSLVLIDTEIEKLFGSNREEVRFFAENYLKPICHYLKLWLKKEELSTVINEIVRS